MKKFSDRISADWYTEAVLSEILDEFFSDSDIPKTLTHLYSYLNIDYIEFIKRQQLPQFSQQLTLAYNLCEQWVVEHGFSNDKAFARWYLANYHAKEAKVEASSDLTINFMKL